MSCEEFAKQKAQSVHDKAFTNLAEDSGWRSCPRCKNMSELIQGGCKFVYCICKARFCYLCGVELLETQHYSHFQGPGCNGPYGDRCLGFKDGVQPSPSTEKPAESAGSKGVMGRIEAFRRRIPAQLKNLM